MARPLSRRDVLKGVVTAGTTAIMQPCLAMTESPLRVGADAGQLTLTAVSAHTVRITIQPVRNGEPVALQPDGALVEDGWPTPIAKVRSLALPLTVRSGNLTVTATPDPFSVIVETSTRRVIQELSVDHATGALEFKIAGGLLLGLGQGGPQFDRRGHVDAMTSGQGGYKLATHGARVPIQLLLGTAGWGMFIHAPLGTFDLSGEKGRVVAFRKEAALPIDVFVIGAETPAETLQEYARITGLPEMPPLWALGYQQSHRTLDAPADILAEAQIFRDKHLPCDALIYLGTGFCPNGWNTDNGEFAWNTRAFPQPAHAIEQFHSQNFRVVLHVVLEGERLTGSVHESCTGAPLPSGKTAEGKWPPERQAACYWPFHKPLADLGVDGWWPDQGDDLDAASRLARIRMYFEGQQLYRPGKRVYALHRNGYAGMQRYAAFLWSGDVLSTWETLKTHVPVAVNAGLSGIPFWGTDIGGFVPTSEYTGELFARWFQFAAFCPLFRSHGRDWKLHRPWGWTEGEIGYPETPGYNPPPEVLHNPAIEPVCKKYLELRYRLMPYIYAAVKQTCETGVPIIRALWLHFPDDPQAVARSGEYLFGRDLLVAPVVEKGVTRRSLYLPRGTWYDFWTNERHEGGGEIVRSVDLSTMPIYIRAGAVIPMGPVKQCTSEKVDDPITVTVFPGADGESFLYEDDGETFEFREGAFMRVEMQWKNENRRLSLRLAPGSRVLRPIPLEVKLAASEAGKTVLFKGDPIVVTL